MVKIKSIRVKLITSTLNHFWKNNLLEPVTDLTELEKLLNEFLINTFSFKYELKMKITDGFIIGEIDFIDEYDEIRHIDFEIKNEY